MDDAEGGNGGRLPFGVMKDFIDELDEPDPRRVVDSEEPSEWDVLLFSHVSGGPET